MKKHLTLVLSFFYAFNLLSQNFDSTAWKYANSITAEELSKHLHIIASDEYEGRETGKAGQKKAMEYLRKEFKDYGIEDTKNLNYIQKFPLVEQESKGVILTIDQKNYELNSDFIISPSMQVNRVIETNVVFVGHGIEEENYSSYKDIDVKNKFVFIWKGTPKKAKLTKEWTSKEKIELAKEKGAIGVMYYNDRLKAGLEMYKHYYERKTVKLKDDFILETPVIALTEEPANAILMAAGTDIEKLNKKGLKKHKNSNLPATLIIEKPTTELSGENVLAYIPGTDKKEDLLIITAHYDHIGTEDSLIFNGADDDGTGTVALLEIAQAFQTAVSDGVPPRRSVLIMPVSGEEKGLLGSKYYSNHPTFPLENTIVNLNVDMIGRYDEAHANDSNYIYLIGADRLSKDLHDLSEQVNETYMKIGLDYTFNDENDPNRFYYRSDHYNFAKNDIPVIFYFSGVHEDYHKATDTVEKIDFNKTERVAKLIFLTAWQIANQEATIQLNEAPAED